MSKLKIGNDYVESLGCLVDFLKKNWTPGPGMFAGTFDYNQMRDGFVTYQTKRFFNFIDSMPPNERTTYLNKLIENRNIIATEIYYDPQYVKRNIINSFWSTFDLPSPLYGQSALSQDYISQDAVKRTLEGMDCCVRAIRQLYPDLVQQGPDMGLPEPGPDIGGKSRKKRWLKNKQYRKRTNKRHSRKRAHSRKKVKCARKST